MKYGVPSVSIMLCSTVTKQGQLSSKIAPMRNVTDLSTRAVHKLLIYME
jgi:hypothetical protein